MSRPPLPPFDAGTAAKKARLAEEAWNSRDPRRDRLFKWPLGPRPENHPGLTELGL